MHSFGTMMGIVIICEQVLYCGNVWVGVVEVEGDSNCGKGKRCGCGDISLGLWRCGDKKGECVDT
jgi:hypothetical protein